MEALTARIEQLFARNYWRERELVEQMRPLLAGSVTVLDLGAGSCKMAKILAERERLGVTAIDVVDHNVTDVSLTLYSGDQLPFSDRNFDTVLLMFVLHHAEDPGRLLREAIRVSRSQVLIMEDAPSGPWQRWIWRTWDYLLNHGAHSDIRVAHAARTVPEWLQYFESFELRPRHVKSFRTAFPLLRTVRHVVVSMLPSDSPQPHGTA